MQGEILCPMHEKDPIHIYTSRNRIASRLATHIFKRAAWEAKIQGAAKRYRSGQGDGETLSIHLPMHAYMLRCTDIVTVDREPSIIKVGLTEAVSSMVLVKYRQNVANKLFITRVFNPVRPHTWLTALSALLRLLRHVLNALICPKEVEASSFSLWGTESTYNTVVVDVSPAGSVGCVARVPSKTRLWYFSLSAQLTN